MINPLRRLLHEILSNVYPSARPFPGTRAAYSTGTMRLLHLTVSVLVLAAAFLSPSSATAAPSVVVSVPDQTLALVDRGVVTARFPVSTSKFGLGDNPNSYATPLGTMEIASKIGGNAPMGAVFKSRKLTGEILPPNAAGRDPIVTRILWLRGLEKSNARAYSRNIYIHGTPVEKLVGRPVSYGCIRMRSRDVARLFGAVNVRTKVAVLNTRLKRAVAQATLQENAGEVRLAAKQQSSSGNRQRLTSSSGKRLSAASAKTRPAI
jgi:lipoprotein-anchoring transpeptidase ErfK/SrfK